MPRLDGFGFVRRLRRAPPFHRTLTVAVTGLSRATDIAATRTAGFDGHLIKPITLEMIDRLLERAVEGHRGADQPFWTPDFLARRPVIDPQTLFARIRQRMASGTLPCDDCTVTWYGEGRRRLCAACDQRILGTDTEIECDLPRGGTICFHQRCYDVWHSALTP
jgi:DNA-binding response OmpR family regulator